MEILCQPFRQFGYHDTPGPWEALSQLRVLCCEWLRPEIHTKEQILELLGLEQFLTILPQELHAWVQEHCPESAEEASLSWRIWSESWMSRHHRLPHLPVSRNGRGRRCHSQERQRSS